MYSGRLITYLLCVVTLVSGAYAEGIFEAHTDIGEISLPGSVKYDSESQAYTVEGSGANMWFNNDAFFFVWKRMQGDFILRARAAFLGEGTDPHRKMGWIIRSTLDADAPYVDAAVHGDGLTAMQFRRKERSDTEELRSSQSAPDVIQLARSGNRYTMSVAVFGDTLVNQTISGIDLGDTVYVGLFVCAHNDTVLEKALFRNVRIIVPPKKNFIPYRDFIGSNLEILDVFNGIRTVVYQDTGSIQAPNWTNDNQALIYNAGGRLYRFDLAKKKAELINTGFATANNNDHVLSFDGRMIGISHHPETSGYRSIIYVLPVTGGTPQQITDTGPSYLHGWSPDGKYLIYTAERNGEFDIYKIAFEGSEEIRLTDTPGLDDGSEYTPDGAFIYFNSVRSGKMEIWRMNSDGSEQTQVTRDNMNNWFPHISPDGKWIVFLSYGADVEPGDHPFYQQVYLRMMPVEGGIPRVIAYVFGGQGTINVPSWSPDSRRIAFVSNTD